MSKRPSHIHKTKEEKQRYIKLIDQIHPDPTIEEQPTEFDPSNAVGKEIPELLSDSVRQPPLIDQIKEYIKSHWLEWAFLILIVALGYFVTDSRLKDVDQGKSIEFHEKQIEEIKEEQQQQNNSTIKFIENINNSITDLKLLTNELLIKFEFLEEKIDN